MTRRCGRSKGDGMKKILCDRCGKEIRREYEDPKIELVVKIVQIYEKVETKDLCPECMAEFRRFMGES